MPPNPQRIKREVGSNLLNFVRLTLLQVLILGLACCRATAEHFKVTKTAEDAQVQMDGGVLSIRPIIDGAIRIRFSRSQSKPEPSVILIGTFPPPRFKVEENSRSITVSTSTLRVILDRSSLALTFSDGSGKILLQEKTGGRSLKQAPPEGSGNMMAEQTFVSPSDEYLFGTGQFQDGYLNVKGLPRRLTQVNTQISIPFLLSSRGYGLLWHNYGLTELNPADNEIALSQTAEGIDTVLDEAVADGKTLENRKTTTIEGEFTVAQGGKYGLMLDEGQSMGRHYRVKIDGKTRAEADNYWLPPTASWLMSLEPGKHKVQVMTAQVDAAVKNHPSLFIRKPDDSTTLRSPNAKSIDYVVFAGPSGDDVISRYREVSGAAPLMPVWAYGFIDCQERFHSQKELLDTAEEYRDRKLPMDLMVQDYMYWGRYGFNAMRFDEQNYPDAAAMVEKLHQMHAHLMVSVWSKFDDTTDIGKEFLEKSYTIPGTPWVDFFNPAAASLFWQDIHTRMLPLDIDAWWLDATEPENDALHGRTVDGVNGDDVRLLYSLFVNKTVYEGQRKDAPDKRVFILTRNAFSGQQRYASATWSGDVGSSWDSLKRQITSGLDFSASGMPYWTTDTGGFFRPGPVQFTDEAYHELLLRWLEFSTFSPLMRVHGWHTETGLWLYGQQVEDVSRKYLDLRHRLLPYIYSGAADVTLHGSTLMRPLVMDFAQDEKALEQKYEFMFGKELLVAPVLSPGARDWDVYLPEDRTGWVNFWTGQTFQGGQTVRTSAKLNEMPLFVRAGSIIPIGPTELWANEKPDAPIEIRVFPGADATFSLYDDEGTNYNYEKGAYSIIPMNWNDRSHELTFGKREGSYPGMPNQRLFSVLVVKPADSREMGTPVPVAYDGVAVTVHVK